MSHYSKQTSRVWSALLGVVLLSLGPLLAGCGDDYLALVVVTPGTAAVSPGGQVAFSAAVIGLDDKSVDWAVNGVVGGDESCGTISEDGLYTAPAQVPEGATVTITATCCADASVHGDASVTIVTSITVEMEDFLTFYDDGGSKSGIVTCSGASGGKAVEGFDVVGDYMTFQVSFEVPGRYSAALRQAAPYGAHNQVEMSLEGAGPDGSDQEALFDIEGEGIT